MATSWTKARAIDITRRHGCHGQSMLVSSMAVEIGGCMGSPGRVDDPDRRTAPISLRSRAGGQRWRDWESGFRDTHGRRVVRWPPLGPPAPWGRARPKAAALEGVQPSWLHVSVSGAGLQDQGSRGGEDSLDARRAAGHLHQCG